MQIISISQDMDSEDSAQAFIDWLRPILKDKTGEIVEDLKRNGSTVLINFHPNTNSIDANQVCDWMNGFKYGYLIGTGANPNGYLTRSEKAEIACLAQLVLDLLKRVWEQKESFENSDAVHRAAERLVKIKEICQDK